MEIICFKCNITVLGEGDAPNTSMVCEFCNEDSSRYLTLKEAQNLKNISIDEHTMKLIYSGFQFDSRTWSMSDRAQGNWAGIIASLGAGLLAEINFPMILSDVNDVKYELSWANRFYFLGTALMTVKSHKGSGSELKERVKNSLTINEVNAIIDNR